VNPLGRIRSIKVKLGIVIVAGTATTLVAIVLARRLELAAPAPIYQRWTVLVSGLLALLVIQLLARGMTSPLREMAAAAKAMARGEHGQQVTVRGRDEVAQLAEAFNTMSRELAETDRMRRELVANVSHELRTPISAVRASLENVIDGVEPADPQTLIAMRGQLERLGDMVEQLLDLSRLEAEGATLQLSEFPARRLLDRARDEAVLSAGNGAAVEVAASPDDLRIVADEVRLQQVVTNLIDNALRHSPAGEPVTARIEARGSAMHLDVSDRGPGIPPDQRSRVFERFYSGDSSRTSGGAGLGLSIAEWVVSMHGGSIAAEEAGPVGCRMVVELPGAVRDGEHRG
jgi:signal transduction histidine kinase